MHVIYGHLLERSTLHRTSLILRVVSARTDMCHAHVRLGTLIRWWVSLTHSYLCPVQEGPKQNKFHGMSTDLVIKDPKCMPKISSTCAS